MGAGRSWVGWRAWGWGEEEDGVFKEGDEGKEEVGGGGGVDTRGAAVLSLAAKEAKRRRVGSGVAARARQGTEFLQKETKETKNCEVVGEWMREERRFCFNRK